MTTYFALYKEPLNKLFQHPKPEVRSWAKTMLRQLDALSRQRSQPGRRARGTRGM